MNYIFFGHHKCASRFFRLRIFGPLARSLGRDVVSYAITDPPYHFADLPDLDLDMVDFDRLSDRSPVVLNLLNSSDAVRRRVDGVNPEFRGLRVVRDPRQVLVSGYFHHVEGHPIESPNGFVWDALARDRPVLRELSVEEGLLYEMDHIGGSVIDEQLDGWWDDERVLEVRVEDVNADRAAFIDRLEEHLGATLEFEPSWSSRFSDSGAGSWQEVFTPRVGEAFDARFGSHLRRLGYAETVC